MMIMIEIIVTGSTFTILLISLVITIRSVVLVFQSKINFNAKKHYWVLFGGGEGISQPF
jgi:hypothetical protein